MELFFLSLLSLIVIFISLFPPFFVYKHKPSGDSNLPPGKTGWPIIGETLEFISAYRKDVLEKFIQDRMTKYSSEVFKTSLFGEKTAVFCGLKGNKFLFSNETTLVTTWWPRMFDKILLTSSQASTVTEDFKQMRKLLPGILKPEALQRYVSVMDSVAKQHLDTYWNHKEEMTVHPFARKYTFSLACRLFLSIDDHHLEAKLAETFCVLCAGLTSSPIDFPGTRFNCAIKAAKFIRREILEIIKQRKIDLLENRKVLTQDFLSQMLLTCDENGQFNSEVGIADSILGLLTGGHDTAASTITFILKYLAELPDVYNEVLKEQMEIAVSKAPEELLNWEDFQKMKYSWNVVNEVMRLTPPAQGSFRVALTNFNYAGFSIPKGWKLYWSVHSTHKNPDYFPDPEKFKPSRFEGHGPPPYTFVPFGGGPRMCPAKEFARYEILAFMHNVVTRFKWEKLLHYENTVINLTPAPAKGFPIRIEPRISKLQKGG